MNIYLAGSCSKEQRPLMDNVKNKLRTITDTNVYAPWELKIPNAWDYSQEDWARLVFSADVQAIKNSDVVVIISQGRMSSAGTNWEQGFAYALGKKVICFQITNGDTSLMTFWGCTTFINSCEKSVVTDVYKIVKQIKENNLLIIPHSSNAATVLT